MLFHVRMDVDFPHDIDPQAADALKEAERTYALGLQRDGRWRELWRIVGEYANISIFDVQGNDELHDVLSSLPLYPYMKIRVTPLVEHPSRLRAP
ncbi:muconolactone Delta-isomerase [Microbacterium sp. LMC-P-041]|uniref:muconolactone Delta-isomerase n=1 Tax=Microbacterium sp. LMC-P-041 TaxID=3040293 RepID=UPI0025531DEA|nr:muconolactone Delta-isomerase [Microbacterium sp. LMC-P-041]